jgi:BlaI family penicillinase repressor
MQNNISGSEWRIMQLLWETDGTMTSAEIVAGVKDKRDRSPKTIKTLLQRLVAKGFVEYTIDADDSRVYHYFPKVSEGECIKKENKEFVSRY